jgi:hypothetical protein
MMFFCAFFLFYFMFLFTFCCFWAVVYQDLVGLSCEGDICFCSELLLVDKPIFGISSASTPYPPHWDCFSLIEVWLGLHLVCCLNLRPNTWLFDQGIEDWKIIIDSFVSCKHPLFNVKNKTKQNKTIIGWLKTNRKVLNHHLSSKL